MGYLFCCQAVKAYPRFSEILGIGKMAPAFAGEASGEFRRLCCFKKSYVELDRLQVPAAQALIHASN